jgi:expansin (peptidoglycan-binding protein)
MVSLARANLPDKSQGNGYAVTVGTPDKEGTKYETSHYPTQAKTGRLMLKREAAEMICMVAEGSKDPLRELVRIPFTANTVKQARLYADAGGSETAVDVRLSQFRLRAEEIVGGFPKRDQPTNIPWWPFVTGFFFVAVIVLLVIRRRRQQN